MEQRLTPITLGVADYGRAKSFYEAMGWTVAKVHAVIDDARRNGAEVTREPAETF